MRGFISNVGNCFIWLSSLDKTPSHRSAYFKMKDEFGPILLHWTNETLLRMYHLLKLKLWCIIVFKVLRNVHYFEFCLGWIVDGLFRYYLRKMETSPQCFKICLGTIKSNNSNLEFPQESILTTLILKINTVQCFHIQSFSIVVQTPNFIWVWQIGVRRSL